MVAGRKINPQEQTEQSRKFAFSQKCPGFFTVCIFLLFFAVHTPVSSVAQDTSGTKLSAKDTIPAVKHSPRKATIYALVMPGLGQAYNHKYWKMPIVYAGFGACIYFVVINTRFYRDFSDAYQWASVSSKNVAPTPPNIFQPPPPNETALKYSEADLKYGRDFYRRYLEISYIATGIWYILTVMDATVDAHFFDYDIGDDLTLNVKPWVPAMGTGTQSGLSGGINLTMRF